MLPRSRPAPADVAPVTSMSRIKTDFALQRQEKALSSDPKYKKYQAHVEKSLASFESVAEWPDFITFLAKLLKTLQSYPQFTVIPHKLTVAKRLAQCLNPALPTGVHQRALDVYVHILNTIGPDNLRRDLAAWSSGLFPFFQYAATSVRPIVLGIYSKFYLPLQEALRPCTKAFVLALLPGVEEETSEFFEKVSSLLDQLSGTVSPPFFFQHLWLILMTAPASRVSALNYLARRLPSISPQDRISPIVGDDPGLMIRGFSAALDEGQVLVQRAVLDLLCSSLQLEGKGFKSEVRPEDQALLVRSALSIVLRRDLSLSRRLYTWLLGKSESTPGQIEYFRAHALNVVSRTIREDWSRASAKDASAQERQKPFKIFVSLLDRWEIGSVLTQHLVLELLAALEKTIKAEEHNDELLVTASMLFEGLDPYLTWQQFFITIKAELTNPKSSSEVFRLVSFVCRTFRFHDAEIQRLHVPLLAFALVDMVEDILLAGGATSTTRRLSDALQLLHEILEEIPNSFYGPPDAQTVTEANKSPGVGKTAAADFYSASNITEARLPDASIGPILHASGLQAVLKASACSAAPLASGQTRSTDEHLAVFSSLMDAIAQLLAQKASVRMDWQPDAWIQSVLPAISALPGTQAGFDCLAASLQALVALHRAPIEPALDIDTPQTVACLMDKMISFLAPRFGPVHVETVRLLWTLEALTQFDYIESILCERMSSVDEYAQAAAFDAFGTLWRLTDDDQLPGKFLAGPLFLVLDGSKSDNFATRQAAEAWMRCHFKSYVRLLDPIMTIATDPGIQRSPTDLTSGPCTVQLQQYVQPFDQARVHHALLNLHNLFLTRGAGFMKVAKTSLLKQSFDPDVVRQAGGMFSLEATYIDAFCSLLVDFLVSDNSDSFKSSPTVQDLQLHSVAIDLLQVFLQRSDLEADVIGRVRHAFLSRLLWCIEFSHQTLQNKLLHALHATFQAKVVQERRSSGRFNHTTSHGASQSIDEKSGFQDGDKALLAHVLVRGISSQVDGASVHHWVDFLFLSVTHLRQSLEDFVFPLIITVVQRLRAVLDQVKDAFDVTRKGKGVSSGANDTDFVALAGLLEKLMLYAIEESRHDSVDPSSPGLEKPSTSGEPSGGFLNYMSGVLGTSDAPVVVDNEIKSTAPLVVHLNHVIQALGEAYSTSDLLRVTTSDETTSQGLILGRINNRAFKSLERLYKSLPAQTTEALVFKWTCSFEAETAASTVQLLQRLAPSAQNIVATCCDRISLRSPTKSDKARSGLLNAELTDEALFMFVEDFVSRIDPPVAISIWNAYSGFLRDAVLTAGSIANPLLLPSLRCMTALADRMAMTPALEDRRLRRDLHDVFQRLLDATLSLAARSSDQLRRSRTRLHDNCAAADVQPLPNSVSHEHDLSIAENNSGTLAMDSKTARGSPRAKGIQELNELLAQRVLPKLKAFHFDNDRIALLCTSIMQTCIIPVFGKRTPLLEAEDHAFRLLASLAQVPQAQKVWKPAIADWYYDNRIFSSSRTAAGQWQPIVQQLMSADKERFLDLISKVTTTASANIFANRELEAISKGLSIRRLTFTLWCGERNKYLTQLPNIQEKLVDVLRANVGEVVHREVYLCLRVLLCRISQEHMTSFWPVVLTEMLRTFESLLDGPVDRKDSLSLVLGACKFLDLLLTLQTEDFQIHQWMFVTDTVDAVYPPDGWTPQAIMDCISVMISDHRASSAAASSDDPTDDARKNVIAIDAIVIPSRGSSSSSRVTRRRPLLTNVRQKTQLDSLASLDPFFGRISLYSFESAYAQGKVDWDDIAASIENDIFEG